MKQLIKYAALLFALVLSASIIGGCLTAGVAVVKMIVDKTGGNIGSDRNNDENDLWYRDENGNVVFLGLHFGKSSGEVKSGTEQFDVADINSMDLEVGSCELVMEVWENDYISVDYENIPVEYEIYEEDETLVIEKEDSINFVWNTSFAEKRKIQINVPASLVFERIDVDKGSGSAKLIGLSTEEIYVDNGSGGVGISDVVTKKLHVDSGSGGVNISNTSAERSVFYSGSGSFIVQDSTLGETAMDSGSGFVNLENVVARNLVLEAGSGRVDVSGILTGNCMFESGSGSVNVVVYGEEEDYSIRTDMGSGSFYLNGRKEEKDYDRSDKRAQYLLVFEAGSGRVSLEFDESGAENAGTALDVPQTQNEGNYDR